MSGSVKKHAKLGASNSHRWMQCPGSVALTAKAPEQKSSPYAVEGTCAHECLERILTKTGAKAPSVGDVFVGVEVTEEIMDCVQLAADYVIDRHLEMRKASLFVEKKVSLRPLGPGLFGTCDIILAEPNGKLLVLDYKHGQGHVVDPMLNSQLAYYVLGAFYEFNQSFQFTSIEVGIIQPRAYHEDGPIRTVEYPMEYVGQWETAFEGAFERIKKEKDLLVLGDHCTFCPAAGICPALQENALKTAKAEFDDEKQIVVPHPTELTIKEISKVLDAASLIENWIREVRTLAHNMAVAGEEIPGFKLVQRRSNRKWISEVQAANLLSLEVDPEKLFKKSFLSPAQAEKLVGKKAVEELTFKPESGTTLVAESDKRPAALTGAAGDFN